MGASLDTGKKGSRDVHLNIVPFIDLMSCLTAFLLVTAVWSNLSKVDVASKGISRQCDPWCEEDEPVNASVHVTNDAIWIGLSRINDFQKIEKVAGEHDWKSLRTALDEYKQAEYFSQRRDIEVAADDSVTYQNLIATIDVAVAAGFADVGVTDPAGLSARAQL